MERCNDSPEVLQGLVTLFNAHTRRFPTSKFKSLGWDCCSVCIKKREEKVQILNINGKKI